jgi:multidrug resistance efflux pump
MFPNHRFFLAAGILVAFFVGTIPNVKGDRKPLQAQRTNIQVAQAELQAAEATLKEAEQRLKIAEALRKQNAISKEDVDLARLTYERARADVVARKTAAEDRKSIQVATPVEGIVVECLVKEGDKVQVGQVLARLDDRMASLEVERAKIRIHIVQAEIEGARNPAESAAKKAALKLAMVEVQLAELHLDKHVIRSPVAGIVRTVNKNKGEGIRKLDPVVRIQPSE